MAFNIAVAGKGGTGKSTLSALIIRYITEELGKPVSAVDADPNASLGALLGLHIQSTVADIRKILLKRRQTLPGCPRTGILSMPLRSPLLRKKNTIFSQWVDLKVLSVIAM